MLFYPLNFFVKTGFLICFWSLLTAFTSQELYLQHCDDEALDEVKREVRVKGYIPKNAWVIPSLIAQRQGLFQPRVLSLKSDDQEIESLFNSLKIEQLLLIEDIEYAEKIYRDMIRSPQTSNFLVRKSQLDILEKKIQRNIDLNTCEKQVNELLGQHKDAVMYASALRLLILIQLSKEDVNHEKISKSYRELLLNYPEQDKDYYLLKKIQEKIKKKIIVDDFFQNKIQRQKYLRALFKARMFNEIKVYVNDMFDRDRTFSLGDYSQMILALSYFFTFEMDLAISHFEELRKQSSEIYYKQISTLLMAESLMKINEFERAKKLVLSITNKLSTSYFNGLYARDILLRIALIKNDEIAYFKYQKYLDENDFNDIFASKNKWQAQWYLIAFSQNEQEIERFFEEESSKETAQMLLGVYRKIQKKEQLKSLGESIGLFPLTQTQMAFCDKYASGNMEGQVKKWQQLGFEEWLIPYWRYTYYMKHEEDPYDAFLLSDQEQFCLNFIIDQKVKKKEIEIPSWILKKQFPEVKRLYVQRLSQSKMEEYFFLAAAHPKTQQFFNIKTNFSGMNPTQSQLISWAYISEFPLENIEAISIEDERELNHHYFQFLNQRFQSILLKAIAMKRGRLEAERIQSHGPFLNLKQLLKWVEDEECEAFLKSLVHKFLIYQFLDQKHE